VGVTRSAGLPVGDVGRIDLVDGVDGEHTHGGLQRAARPYGRPPPAPEQHGDLAADDLVQHGALDQHRAPSMRPESKAAALGGSSPGRPLLSTWTVPAMPGRRPGSTLWLSTVSSESIRRIVCAATASALSKSRTPGGSAAVMARATR